MKFIEDISVDINKEDVFRLLGRRNSNTTGRTDRRLTASMRKVRHIVKPRVLYSVRKIEEVGKEGVTLEGGISLKSKKLSRTLSKCDEATVFLATIGNNIDGIISNLANENRLSEAFIYDAIGSVAVEGIVEDFQNRFDLNLSKNSKSTTIRFSPGYCDWNIKEQKKIFNVLDGKLAGVSLSPSFLMKPRKSVSGVFGIASGSAKKRPNPCTMCSKENCIARR